MRVVFMGTPDFSVPALMEIIAQGHEVVAVYSQPPRKAGRGMDLKKSPVQEKAEQFSLPVFTPLNFKDEVAIAQFRAHDADVAVVVAYGLLLPEAVLKAPRFGCLNLHASLLPRWRGAAPINRAIMAGDRETGIMVMQMDEGLDSGPVAMVERVAIPDERTAGELHDQLMVLGGDLIARALSGLERGGLSTKPQAQTGIEYARKLANNETRIDWSKSALEVHNHIRGLSPAPGAWCEFSFSGKVHRLKVLKATLAGDHKAAAGTLLDDVLSVACGKGALRLTMVQRSGKAVMTTEEFLRGNPLTEGMVLA